MAMKTKIKFIILIFLTLFLLSGCESYDELDEDYEVPTSQYAKNSTTRFYDEEACVVCWVFEFSYRGSISCLPIDQTELTASDFE